MKNLEDSNKLNSIIEQIANEHRPGFPPSKGSSELFDNMTMEEIEKAFANSVVGLKAEIELHGLCR